MNEAERKAFTSMLWTVVPKEYASAYVRKNFDLSAVPSHAKLYVCGLGFFELYINGQKVTDELYNPVWSDYRKRDIKNALYPNPAEFSHRIYYRTYAAERFLKKGKNSVCLLLGNGWYRQKDRTADGEMQYGENLRYVFALFSGGKVVADSTETKCRMGHIVHNNIFHGEIQDLALLPCGWTNEDFDDAEWKTLFASYEETSALCEQKCPCDEVCETIVPRLVYEWGDGKIYDAGKNISGFATVKAFRNEIDVRYAEELSKSGTALNTDTCGNEDQPQRNTYLNVLGAEGLHPIFCVHGFRYVQVRGGEIESISFVHTRAERVSSFSCADSVLNWYHDTFVHTQLCNMHYGVPSDCPHIERLGYTGDGQLTVDAALLTLGTKDFYKKWMRDIADCQDVKTGHVQHTAPYYGGGGGPGGWGCSIVYVPYSYYLYSGDATVLEEYYPNMLRWLDCMRSFCTNGLVVRELEGGWCLGDWCTPDKVQISEELVNTYFLVRSLDKTARIAEILGKAADADKLRAWRETHAKALRAEYCPTGVCNRPTQGSDVFLADLGLLNREEIGKIAKRYERLGVFDTGIFGTEILIKLLLENGYADTAFKLLTAETYPSFGYMRKMGATTLWERFDGVRSHNHPMFGAAVKHLYSGFAGITQRENTAGYDDIIIKPVYVQGLFPLKCSLSLGEKQISVCYEVCGDALKISVTLSAVYRACLRAGEKELPLTQGENNLVVPICDVLPFANQTH